MMQYGAKLLVILSMIMGSFFLGSTYYWYSPRYPSVTKAIAIIHPTKGNTTFGSVTFLEERNGLRVKAILKGLTPGMHGFHIHELGDCSCPDATCTQGHFNPTQQQHGGPESSERHVGDMGNLTADQDGNASYEYIDHYMKLNGPLSIVGRSVIVHSDADDFVSQPTGNAGSRIGCGVIGIAR
jgi:Cu-Zn family superoxide dismutase